MTISAAASLQDALVETENAYKQTHAEIEIGNNFGSSGTLAREIEEGAPVDAFFSAAAKPMDDLESKGLIVPESRQNLLRNSLVLIAPLDSNLQGLQSLTDSTVRLIAIGDPASVPAGQYGQQCLAALHLLDAVKSRLLLGKDVRQVLAYVETGNADVGLVYATDARTSGRVRIVAAAPDTSHDPIVYPAAVLKASTNSNGARAFVQFLASPQAEEIFRKHGFTIASS